MTRSASAASKPPPCDRSAGIESPKARSTPHLRRVQVRSCSGAPVASCHERWPLPPRVNRRYGIDPMVPMRQADLPTQNGRSVRLRAPILTCDESALPARYMALRLRNCSWSGTRRRLYGWINQGRTYQIARSRSARFLAVGRFSQCIRPSVPSSYYCVSRARWNPCVERRQSVPMLNSCLLRNNLDRSLLAQKGRIGLPCSSLCRNHGKPWRVDVRWAVNMGEGSIEWVGGNEFPRDPQV